MTPFIKDEAWITQYFGYTDYAKGHYAAGYHEGLDIVPLNRVNWDLFTPIAGVVKWASTGDVYGKNVIIYDEHTGLSYRYCHLDSISVREGESLNRGDRIGVIGNTGKSSGRHLHMNVVPMYEYGVKDFGGNGFSGRVDPLAVLRALGVWI